MKKRRKRDEDRGAVGRPSKAVVAKVLISLREMNCSRSEQSTFSTALEGHRTQRDKATEFFLRKPPNELEGT